jgi:hypothetical protein
MKFMLFCIMCTIGSAHAKSLMDPPEQRFMQMENDTDTAPSLSPALMNSSIPGDMTEAPVSNSTAAPACSSRNPY